MNASVIVAGKTACGLGRGLLHSEIM
jgi:hypothetical protein